MGLLIINQARSAAQLLVHMQIETFILLVSRELCMSPSDECLMRRGGNRIEQGQKEKLQLKGMQNLNN